MKESRGSLSDFRRLAADAAGRSHVPYSNRRAAVVLVLGDGSWIPGVRVESATFSLTIPPLLNAVTTAVALGVDNVRAAVASQPLNPYELTYAGGMYLLADLPRTEADVLGAVPGTRAPRDPVRPFLTRREAQADAALAPDDEVLRELTPELGIDLARRIAGRAHVPASDFPVGCLLEIEGAGFIPGVNVEHDDWTQILCAERNALATAVSYGYGSIESLYLSCLRAARCTPCGACRQLLAELAPTSALWMDGGADPPAASDPVTLLPGLFSGSHLSRNT